MSDASPRDHGQTADVPGKSVTKWYAHPLVVVALMVVVVPPAFVGCYYTVKGYNKSKALTIRFYGKSRLMEAGAAIRRLAVSVDGAPVADPCQLVVSVASSGDLEIRPEDFAAPIVLPIAGARPVAVEVAATTPGKVAWKAEVDGAEVKVGPTLMNPGDGVTLIILCDGMPEWPSPVVRIAGLPAPAIVMPSAEQYLSAGTRRFLTMAFLLGFSSSLMLSFVLAASFAKAFVNFLVRDGSRPRMQFPRRFYEWVAFYLCTILGLYLYGYWLSPHLNLPLP